MAIKTRNSRDTFRSDVKSRPLNQNGLEAQYQGLDIKEVNIDHAGLAIIGQGGYQTRRNIVPMRKQYIVDVDNEEHYPTAEIIFELANGAVDISRSEWSNGQSLQGLIGESFEITDAAANTYIFEYSITVPTGDVISANVISVNIVDNLYSMVDLLVETKNAILQTFPTDTFSIEIYPQGSQQVIVTGEPPTTVIEDKIKLVLLNSAVNGAQIQTISLYFDTTLNIFEDQQEAHVWRLNGFIEDSQDPTKFYEDFRSDTIQFVAPHSRKSSLDGRQAQLSTGAILPVGNVLVDVDTEISNIFDPTGLTRFDTKDSDQVIIRQVPKREQVTGGYRENHQWREDPHFLAQDQQTWSNMESYSSAYHTTFEDHVSAMLDSNFADEQYIDKNPMSGRVDVFDRLSRIFDVEIRYIRDRRPYSVFDQYLESSIDYKNVNQAKFPKLDIYTGDSPFEDNQGKRNERSPMFEDYFNVEPLESHDYYESERWTTIDDDMLAVLTFDANRSMHIDRREWQQSDYVYTATGLISSQATRQDGIMYRELMR